MDNNKNINKNLDWLLSKKKSFSISEFQKVINDDNVASVVTLDSEKPFHMFYEVKLLNGDLYKVYVRMSLEQILKSFKSKKK